MFEIFFGTTNPFAVALDGTGKQVKMIEKIEADIHKEAVTERLDTHTKDLNISCACTLEEFFYGSQKELTFTKNLVFADGKTEYFDTRQTKTINILPGMKEGTVLRFKGEGN